MYGNLAYPIVKVKWMDAETFGDTGWTKMEDAMENAKTKPPIMESIGWVLVNDPEYVAITSDLGPEECGHVTKIPKSIIVDIVRLDSGDAINGEANSL